MNPPDSEEKLGLEAYYTHSPGIRGRLKQQPEDFVVEEVDAHGSLVSLEGDSSTDDIPGAYTHFTLVKRNWDTMRAVKEISKKLGVSQRRLSFAGTKDRKAMTAQRVSVYNTPVERLRALRIKDITLKDFRYADESIGMGDLWGNHFTVTIRGIKPSTNPVDAMEKVMNECGGVFTNYYGIQRFGTVRPVTHLVGREILRNDLRQAVMIYLSKVFNGESDEVKAVRLQLAERSSFKEALKSFPKSLGYEKALLNHLVEKPGDYAGALRRLPKSLQLMFVHAYQSHVFNRALSSYLKKGLSVERLPLVGLETGVDDESARILREDGVSIEDFNVKQLPELSSRGGYRDCFSMAEEFRVIESGGDELDNGTLKVKLSFRLKKGCYATVFLRELMKN
jgi:tRNA pseudouridine13 synthase